MSLSNQQIERYARQIIVPGVGGIAQERLLSARLMLAGKAADVASVLAYMVGAGVGEIRLQLPPSDTAEQDSLIVRATQLNPDVVIEPGTEDITRFNLLLAVADDFETSELIRSPRLVSANVPLILVQLNEPARIAIFSDYPPCPLCADADLNPLSTPRANNAGFVVMVAATEAFKLLACSAPPLSPTLLQFNGFGCTTRQLRQTLLSPNCVCAQNKKT
jgi:hypothetical protein